MFKTLRITHTGTHLSKDIDLDSTKFSPADLNNIVLFYETHSDYIIVRF